MRNLDNNNFQADEGLKITQTEQGLEITGNTNGFLNRLFKGGYNIALTIIIMKMLISTNVAQALQLSDGSSPALIIPNSELGPNTMNAIMQMRNSSDTFLNKF